MKITCDPAKNARNIAERGLSFDRAADFDFETAKFWMDTRMEYPETRIVAIGYLDNRLHVLVFSETGYGIRVISFRKANPREGAKYGFALTRD
ncbi:MAG: hypothetical protein COX17_02380 [Deltaproteobacteria bacterium CG23_combo_of_CG06-09_8_20_14_all_60_8]|nr:MAG: hypothetical protein AUK28_10855 [Desulfobacterales bacterium CG2_30_60_27]PIP44294.1 MAG: hypothetical protein COX17_02380 [Deltaproteobacteria bacterium CG23_combo_of_CG06-09_8_20_14_all_60_8]